MTIDLDALEALAKAATPGPWTACERSCRMIDIIHHNRSPGAITHAFVRVQARDSWVDEATANAAYIAACSPETVLALVRVARAAKATCSVQSSYVVRDLLKRQEDALREAGLT